MPCDLLGLSGSLRVASINTTMLQAVKVLAPDDVMVEVGDFGRALPLFNPDDEDVPIPSVLAFRSALSAADGVIIACPEYAHGVPGAFKNALDWVVASGEFVDKPFALFHANGRGHHARAAIAETLVTMNAHWVTQATLDLAISGTSIETARIVQDPASADAIRAALGRFQDAILKAQQVKVELGALPLPLVRPVFPVS